MKPIYVVLSQYKNAAPVRVEGYSFDPAKAAALAGAELPLRDYIYEDGKAGHCCGGQVKRFPPGDKDTYDGEGNIYRVTYDAEGNLTEFWTEFGFRVWVVEAHPYNPEQT